MNIHPPKDRTPEEFIAWLQGFVDAVKTDRPCRDQWQTLKFNLSHIYRIKPND